MKGLLAGEYPIISDGKVKELCTVCVGFENTIRSKRHQIFSFFFQGHEQMLHLGCFLRLLFYITALQTHTFKVP